MNEKIPARTDPFAVIVPTEMDLTAPVAAATELSKLFISAANTYTYLSTQTWEETIEQIDVHGVVTTRVVIHQHPKALPWFGECRKLLTEIAKLNMNAEVKAVDQKISIVKIFLESKEIPKELKDELALEIMKKRMSER